MTNKMTAASQREIGRDNNFNLIRLIAASGVMFSHSFGLRAGFPSGIAEPIWHVNFISWCAVSVFFIMSGYLVTKSVARDGDVARYLWSRVLRIVPGLVVCTLFTVAVAGLFLTTLPVRQFFSSTETVQFALHNAVAATGIRYYLPGVFENNLDRTINGSLWTLPYEQCCYALLAIGWILSGARRAWVFSICLFLVAIGYVSIFLIRADALPGAEMFACINALRFLFCFGIGIIGALSGIETWVRRPRPVLIATLLVIPLLSLSPTRFAGICVILAAASFWFAFLDGAILRTLRRLPDISYGVYIYAYPVQQSVIAHFREASWAQQFLISAAIICVLSVSSWYLVEKPALSLKKKASAGRERGIRDSARGPVTHPG
jgi:peptidoglycan/LPS O-acetylase OafA/YrhL